MAGENRTAAADLAWLEELRTHPWQFDLYAAVRLFEQARPDAPRVGEATLPSQEVVRFSHEPNLAFPTATVTGLRSANGVEILNTELLGLFGPHGPLPLHFTEYAWERMRDKGDDTLVRFLDIFQHRMMTLFYRAWANSQPVANLERQERDRFSLQVGSIAGVGTAAFVELDALPQHSKLRFMGLLSHQKRDAASLQALIGGLFSVPARIEQLVGEWLEVPAADRCLLGVHADTSTLGVSTQLGALFWSAQHKFRVVLGPLSLPEFARFLPGTAELTELTAAVRGYTGDEFDWELELQLQKEEVPSTTLGQFGQLGWTTWLGGRTLDPVAAKDTHIKPALGDALEDSRNTERNWQ
ncbi:MAG: type VI secretion system baseplate subunit TssG [Pseudomonadales bacterium]